MGDERKTVIVVGGSSGIGRATAIRFAREGWRVAVSGSNAKKVNQVTEELGGNDHLALRMDIASDDDIPNGAKQLAHEFGKLDVMVDSAGVSEANSIIDSDFKAWNHQFDLMFYGAVRLARAFVPLMRSGGRIINVTSIHHERVARNYSSYAVAKAAITQYTRALALELANRGILANAIAPGFIDTPMSVKGDGRNELASEWFHDNYVKYDHLPLKRAGSPDEVAGVVYFLAGPDATYITGSVLTVDGGLTITF
jgi:3-oxoacyl-[acyl-carrier protein] reductase